eukprot:CAMPEP_0118919716 /NCGR_PEP_ID=MMETSP1166-20130328/18699_1 /TAXON_ID=1104430 /ORGANISM="Chrysoreinhardia sp, Strain CCMP3193" /LENGTH=289 /DNA_ID=CAMNT_0006860245 /DNA_START=58 /DNA_END=927 /DNA_ORIENTATION=+
MKAFMMLTVLVVAASVSLPSGRDVAKQLSRVALGPLIRTTVAHHAAAPIDYKAVSDDIAEAINPLKGPTLLRLAWHSSGPYRKKLKGFGTIDRFEEEEPRHGHGGNLEKAVKWLEPVKTKYGDALTYGDLYTLAGVTAIRRQARGPVVPWSYGRRVDRPLEAGAPDGGEETGLRYDVFSRMGFTDKDFVALSGAHALGRFNGRLTSAYYSLLLNEPWTPRHWDGPLRYEDPSKDLVMLPSDLLLRDDTKFRKYAEVYAKNLGTFFRDLTVAFQKLEELGCTGLTPVDWA